jgi:hypothetical protein
MIPKFAFTFNLMKLRLLVPALLLLLSCRKKDPVIEPPPEPQIIHDTVKLKDPWQEEPINAFLSNLFIYNGAAQGKYFSFTTNEGLKMSYDSVSRGYGNASFLVSDFNPVAANATARPNMSFGLCAVSIDKVLTISGIVPKWLNFENGVNIDLSKYDQTFAGFWGNSLMGIDNAVITPSGSVYVPAVNSNSTVNMIYRFNTKTTFESSVSGEINVPYKVDTISSAKIVLPRVSASPYARISACGNIGSKAFFFPESEGWTYVLRNDNSFSPVVKAQLFGFFEIAGTWFASAMNSNAIYSTVDGGETWSMVGSFTKQNNWIINFDQRLICISGSSLYQVQLNGSALEFKKIKTGGIGQRIITSVTRFNQKIFLTTNGGIYSRPYSEFYEFE